MFLSSNIIIKIFISLHATNSYEPVKNITCASRGFCSFVFFVRSRIYIFKKKYYFFTFYFFINALDAIIMCMSFLFFLHSINTFSYGYCIIYLDIYYQQQIFF